MGHFKNETLANATIRATHLPRSEAATPAGERAAHRLRSAMSIVAVPVRAASDEDSRPTSSRGILAAHSNHAGGGCRHEQRNGEMRGTTDAHSEGVATRVGSHSLNPSE